LKRALLNRLGHTINEGARIAPVLIVGHSRLTVAEGASIGPFNVIRNVYDFRVGQRAEIGQWNWFSTFPVLVENSPIAHAGKFILGDESSVTSRHFFDASGGIVIGRFTTIAGARSVFMTHGIDVESNTLLADTIKVGDYAMVGACTGLVMGSAVPSYCVIAMGSTVIAGLEQERSLYAGTPARFKKTIQSAKYWERPAGPVMPPWL
jgi:carbonic anhydrase/acetyltransferase-like protein (isoleucine patch superfamily)